MTFSILEELKFQSFKNAQVQAGFSIRTIVADEGCTYNEELTSTSYKVVLVFKGSGQFQVDFNSFEISGSGLFCLSPGQRYLMESGYIDLAYEISFDRDFYCIETHGKEIACNGALFNNIHRTTYLPLDDEGVQHFAAWTGNIVDELRSPGKAHREILETYLRMILIEALRKHHELNLPQTGQKDSANRLVADFIAAVDKHFKKVHSVAEYAKMLHVSPKSLSKRLKASGYKSPTRIISDRIVLEAKRALKYSNESVKEIAVEMGYEDPAYFNRIFKKTVGQSPMRYRRSNYTSDPNGRDLVNPPHFD